LTEPAPPSPLCRGGPGAGRVRGIRCRLVTGDTFGRELQCAHVEHLLEGVRKAGLELAEDKGPAAESKA